MVTWKSCFRYFVFHDILSLIFPGATREQGPTRKTAWYVGACRTKTVPHTTPECLHFEVGCHDGDWKVQWRLLDTWDAETGLYSTPCRWQVSRYKSQRCGITLFSKMFMPKSFIWKKHPKLFSLEQNLLSRKDDAVYCNIKHFATINPVIISSGTVSQWGK